MPRTIIPISIRRLAAVGAVILAVTALLASQTAADHGLGHNGETMTLSKDSDISDGESITVNLSSFLPGASITVVTCFNFPAAGPADCELSNYGQHTATAGNDGTATVEYPVRVIAGRCDHENQCWIVAGDGLGPNANYAGVVVSFSGTGDSGAAESPAAGEPAAEGTADGSGGDAGAGSMASMVLSKATNLSDGETVTAELSGWPAGATVTLVTCFVFPATSPADCDTSNYGRFSATAGDDGSGSVDYQVSMIPGRCDPDNSCFVVASDAIGPQANSAMVPVTFASAVGDGAMEPPADNAAG